MSERHRDWPSKLQLDASAFVAPGAIVVGDVTLGARSSVWFNTVVRGDSDRIVIGADSNVQDNSTVHVDEGSPARIGARVTVGHRAIVHGCVIEDDVLVGMGAVILSGAVIGAGSLIGASALVREKQVIPPGSLVLGTPARVTGEVGAAHREAIRVGAVHYAELARSYRARGIAATMPPTSHGGHFHPRLATPMDHFEWNQRLTVLAEGPERAAAALARHGVDTFRRRPEAWRWSALEVTAHLRDCDAEVFGPRLERALAEEFPAVEAVAAERWVDERRCSEEDADRTVAGWRAVRERCVARLEALGPAEWSRALAHPTRGPHTVGDLVRYWSDHDLSHRRQMTAALAGRA